MPRIPALRPEQVIQALERCGLTVARRRGSHVVLHGEDLKRPVVVAVHRRELSPKTVVSIIKQAGLTVDEFLAKL